MPKHKIRLQSFTGQDGVDLSILDDVNGSVILRVQLTPQELFNIPAGRSTVVAAEAHVMDQDVARLLGVERHTFQRGFRVADYRLKQATSEGAVPDEWNTWAQTMRAGCWAQRSRWGATRDGVTFTIWRYDNDLTEEQRQGIQLLLAQAEPPAGLLAREAK